MPIQCPHCGASVEPVRRHGLSGTLCSTCNNVVPLPREPTPRPATVPVRAPRAPRVESRPTCRSCGGHRDRDGRRCPSCGEPWLFRVGALGLDEPEAHGRLVEYILNRQSNATSRERLERRLQRLPAQVLGGMTEAQAMRARHELENIGVQVALEEDDTVATHNSGGFGFRFDWTWLVLPALLVFAVGVYLLVQSEREARAAAMRREAAAGPPSTAPTDAPDDAPNDVLRGLARVESGGRRGLGIIVDRDGWFVAPLALVDRAGGVTVDLSGLAARGALVRREERLGLGLFRAAAPAGFSLSLGDVGAVKTGDTVFVAKAGERGPELVRTTVIRPDARRGARLFLALQASAELDGRVDDTVGAPVFSREGFLLGVMDPRPAAQRGLAVPANLLVEGQGSLLAEIRTPRVPSPAFSAWRSRVETEARLDNPEIYDSVEKRLLLGLTCSDKLCQAQVGVLAFGAMPVLKAPLTFDLQAVEQAPTDPNPRHGSQSVTPTPTEFVETNPADSPLIQDAPVAARRAIVGGDVEDLRLYVANIPLQRPASTANVPFRATVTGFDGRRSAGTLLEPPAPPTGPPTAASVAPSAEAPATAGPETVFGDLKAREWAERFRTSREAIATQEDSVKQLEAQLKLRPGADGLLARERVQLDRLRARNETLVADADRWKVPAEFRR